MAKPMRPRMLDGIAATRVGEVPVLGNNSPRATLNPSKLEESMKIIGAAAMALALGMASGGLFSSPSTAQPSIQVGPGGVRVDPDSDRYESRRYRGWERRGERCRTIVEQRRNRFGERVERRTRVCD